MDFSKMSMEEREQHYLKVCEQVKLPPDLRLLEFYWVDGGDGGRKLVLWAPKGACDLLRDIHGISITGLTQANGDGYVGWVATGMNKAGRTEMATGAVSTRGLSGENLAKGVAFAQTRACRRVTLAFVGCGILDESELHEMTTSINSAATLPVPTMPTVQPSSAAAVVAAPHQANIVVLPQVNSVVPNLVNEVNSLPKAQNPINEVSLQNGVTVTICDKPVKRGPGPRNIQKMAVLVAPLVEPRAHEAVVEIEEIPSQSVLSISSQQEPTGLHAVDRQPQNPTPGVAAPVSASSAQAPAGFTLADAKKKAKALRSDILEPAGLIPSNNMGTYAKITKFVKSRMGVDDETKLTAQQWKEFFDWTDQQDAAELVKMIDYTAAQ